MEVTVRKEDDPSRHLLSLALTKFEEDSGFKPFATVNGHPRIIQMTGLLSAEDFTQAVKNGHMAKDYVTAEHGVYSHRIQWYCLGKSGKFDADLKALFKQFQTDIAWLLTFDRRPEHPRAVPGGNGNIDPTDFRTPEALHKWLKESTEAAAVCPLLASYIRSKTKKIQGKSWLAIRKVVAARKLFPAKKPDLAWKDLNTKQIETLLARVLSEQERMELDKFLKQSNVLYPQQDGTYKSTPDVTVV
jgi:type VI secretion system protein VasG